MTAEEIIKTVKAEMKNKKLTQHYIARKILTNQCSISNWLSGKTEPSIGMCIALCEAVGFEITIRRKNETK